MGEGSRDRHNVSARMRSSAGPMRDRRQEHEEHEGVLEARSPQYPPGSRRCRLCSETTTLRSALVCARCGGATEVI